MLEQPTLENQQQKYTRLLLLCLLVVVVVRLLISIYLPYMDTTEARYGLISRIVAEKNNWRTWIMPEFSYKGDPFWAKPPLSFWLSALSFKIFGYNEFAGRFPTFLESILTIFIVGRWALKMDTFKLLFFGFVLFTMPVFLMHTNVVSTDTAHNLAVALAMISFWKAINSPQRTIWGYLFFVGLGIGFMTRGPLVLVFVAPPIVVWLFQQKRWKDVWTRIPWIMGLGITAIIAVPWYIAASVVSPGFLDYFIIGEHFRRYLQPGYTADLYGHSRPKPIGIMWLYITEFMAPWIIYVYYRIIRNNTALLKDSWAMFLLCWLFWIPIFFSLSKNVMYTYMLTSSVPCALLVCHWMSFETIKKWTKGMLAFPILLVLGIAIGLIYFPVLKERINTDKYLIEAADQYQAAHPEQEYIYHTWQIQTFSDQYYTKGKCVDYRGEINPFKACIASGKPFFMQINRRGDYTEALMPYVSNFKPLYANYRHVLYLVTPNVNQGTSTFKYDLSGAKH